MPDRFRNFIDASLEGSVIGSYSRIGSTLRRSLFHWDIPSKVRLVGKRVVITGATSGIGKAAAIECHSQGADVVLMCRDENKGEKVTREIRDQGPGEVDMVLVDLADLATVRHAVAELGKYSNIDVLVHNAGTMSKERTLSAQGIELTVATHLIAPFFMSFLLADQLRRAQGRILVVTSGGMYAKPLDIGELRREEGKFNGVGAYALAKRAQVSLVELCSPHVAFCGVGLTAMHPGWVDTPGLKESLPAFYRVMRPLLRTPSDGAETIAWLAGIAPEMLDDNFLWLDRAPRKVHRRAKTRRSDTVQSREALFEMCRSLSGLSEAEMAPWNGRFAQTRIS